MSTFVKNLIEKFESKVPAAPSATGVEAIKAKLFSGAKKVWLHTGGVYALSENGRGLALEKMEKISACPEMNKVLEGFTYSSFYSRGTIEHAIKTKALGDSFIVACPEAPSEDFLSRYKGDLVIFEV